MKTILVPVDFSPVTGSVVRTACEVAQATGHPLVLMHVLSLPTWFETYGLGPEVVNEVMRGGEQLALARLEELARDCDARGVAVESLLPTGKPAAMIVARAIGCDARYIVMGSHGHGPMFDLLIGSTTQGVLRRARCPVFVVPAHVAAAPTITPAAASARAGG